MIKRKQKATSTVETLMTRMAAMQNELDNLKQRTQNLPLPLPQPAVHAKPEVSTTRRKLLRRLAGGLVAGLAVGGIGAALPQNAEAKFVAAKGWGAIVAPPGGTIDGVAPNGTVYGLYATSDAVTNIGSYSPNYKIGVVGLNTSYADGSTYYGVYGEAKDAGVYGKAFGPFGGGVYGFCETDSGHGVIAEATGHSGFGVFALSFGSSGTAIRGVDRADSNSSYAGTFTGKVSIQGTLSKTAGSFKIDHPLDPANKYLYHSFVESSDMMNIYNGIATLDELGSATVEMPEWLEALNSDFRYQLTCLGQYSPVYIAEEIQGRTFKIAGGLPGQRISWQVTGIRQDAYAKGHRIPVEEDKTEGEKGKYLHPELFGQPKEMAVHYRGEPGAK